MQQDDDVVDDDDDVEVVKEYADDDLFRCATFAFVFGAA